MEIHWKNGNLHVDEYTVRAVDKSVQDAEFGISEGFILDDVTWIKRDGQDVEFDHLPELHKDAIWTELEKGLSEIYCEL